MIIPISPDPDGRNKFIGQHGWGEGESAPAGKVDLTFMKIET